MLLLSSCEVPDPIHLFALQLWKKNPKIIKGALQHRVTGPEHMDVSKTKTRNKKRQDRIMERVWREMATWPV